MSENSSTVLSLKETSNHTEEKETAAIEENSTLIDKPSSDLKNTENSATSCTLETPESSGKFDQLSSNKEKKIEHSNEDEWHRCSGNSSSDSEASVNREYEIIVPLKFLVHKQNGQKEKKISNITTNVAEGTTRDRDPDCIVLSDSDNNVDKTVQVKVSDNCVSVEENVSEIMKSKTQVTKPNKSRKRILYTSTDGGDLTPFRETSKSEGKRQTESLNIIAPTKQVLETTTNESYVRSSHNTNSRNVQSDSENVHSISSKRKRDFWENSRSQRNTLCSIDEQSDSEVCPESMSKSTSQNYDAVHKYNSFQTQSKNQFPKRKKQHSCSCRNNYSPKLARKNKSQHEHRKQLMRKEFVKKFAKAFVRALDSSESSSNEESLSVSSDESVESERPKKNHKHKHITGKSKETEPGSSSKLIEMEREVEYWKNLVLKNSRIVKEAEPDPSSKLIEMEKKIEFLKSMVSKRFEKTNESKISPTELRIRELEEQLCDLEDHIASASTRAPNEINSTFSIARTSTPMHTSSHKNNINQSSMPHPESNARIMSRASSADSLMSYNSLEKNHNEEGKARSRFMTNPIRSVVNDSTRNVVNDESFSRNRDIDIDIVETLARSTCVVSRTIFTEKEKRRIIQYIVEHYDRIELIKGKSFWVQMAHDLNTHRSWHSLRNNFFKSIMRNLEKYDVPTKVRNKIISMAKDYM